METIKAERLRLIRKLNSDHKKEMGMQTPLFRDQRNSFMSAIVESKTPDWGSIKVSFWY